MDAVEELLGAPFDPTLQAPRVLDVPRALPAAAWAPPADKVRGMLFGAALGDALGAPHEFATSLPLGRYTGRVEHPLTVVRRFQGGRLVGGVGQITDDTEMTIALARSLCVRGPAHYGLPPTYDRSAAIAGYLLWANSRPPGIGNNTRALFQGVVTARGYQARWDALRAQPLAAASQSNGCLMRASPLAALSEASWEQAAAEDCALTNFHPTCVDAVRAYVCAARALLAGAGPAVATARALAVATTAEVVAAIAAGRDQEARDVTGPQKGWVIHGLHCAFLALNDPQHVLFQDRIDRVVRLGGDTDTNAAIAGALLGAELGESAMRMESRTRLNLAIVLGLDPAAGGLPRPPTWAARRLPALANALAGPPLQSEI